MFVGIREMNVKLTAPRLQSDRHLERVLFIIPPPDLLPPRAQANPSDIRHMLLFRIGAIQRHQHLRSIYPCA